jgi:hypothetical protein
MTVRLPRLLCLLLVSGFALTSHTTSQGALTIGGYQIVKQTRISASEWEITARATLFNGAGAVPGATATVVSLSPAAIIIDNSLTFGAVGAGSSRVADDTFSFRQRPPIGFAGVRLRWTVTPGGGYTPPAGVLLQGGNTSSAMGALVRKDPVGANPADIVNHTILTRLDVAIRPDATVAQINAMLAAINGGIVTMRPLFPVITVAVPRQADAAALAALAATVRSMPGIRLAIPGRTVDVSIAPGHPAADAYNFDHLRAGRFPAAWNANQLADCTRKTTVLVTDGFVDPKPQSVAAFDQEVPGVQFVGGNSQVTHGYEVTATLAATFDDESPTGANPYPSCLRLVAYDMLALTHAEVPLAIEAALPTGNVVLNASIQFSDVCKEPCIPANFSVERAFDRALAGLFMRHILRPYQDRLLIAAAAGNRHDDFMGQIYPGAGLAAVSSAFNVAATSNALMTWADDATLWTPTVACIPSLCFPDLQLTPGERADLDGFLTDLGETTGAPLKHVLIVGATDSTPLHLPSTFSETGAHIFAVGENIPSLDHHFIQGTSFAAPQIAGLASYLMMMLPTRHNDPGVVHDVYTAIMSGRRAVPVQFVDAYASLLSLDPSGAPDPGTWDVRMALLDVNQDGRFDELDTNELANHLLEPPNYDIPVQNAQDDDSRYDLNGDGFTGGGAVDLPAIDLERTGSFRYGATLLETLTIQVGASQRTIDETAVNDLDMLCYYAYSALYTGDTSARDFFLAAPCKGETVYEGTISTILQINGPDDSQTVTSNWTVRLKPLGDGSFEATGSVSYANNGAASYPGPNGSCSTSNSDTGAGPVVYFGGLDTGNPDDLPGELIGVFDLTSVITDSCFGGRTLFYPDNPLSLPFSLTFVSPSDVMRGEYTNGQLTALVWDYRSLYANGSLTIVGRLELAP